MSLWRLPRTVSRVYVKHRSGNLIYKQAPRFGNMERHVVAAIASLAYVLGIIIGFSI